MTAEFTININIKTIRKFAALADIDLTETRERKIINSLTHITEEEFNEFVGDKQAALALAGIIISKQLGDQEQ